MFNLKKAISNKIIHSGAEKFRLALPIAIQNFGTELTIRKASLEVPANLITVSYALLKENEALDNYIEAQTNNAKIAFFEDGQQENSAKLEQYTQKIKKDLRSVDGLSVANYCSAAYLLQQSGLLDQAYFEENLREGIAAKFDYAGLENLISLAVSMTAIGYDTNDALLNDALGRIETLYNVSKGCVRPLQTSLLT